MYRKNKGYTENDAEKSQGYIVPIPRKLKKEGCKNA